MASQREKNDFYYKTQQEVADELQISRPMVGSIEARALIKLRNALEQKGYKMSDFIGGMA